MAIEEQTQEDGHSHTYGTGKEGQRLTISNREVTKLAFRLAKVGSPTGNITFAIRRVSNDSVIVSKIWGDAGDLPIDDPVWKEVTFDSPTTINEEVRICFETSGGNADNYIRSFYKTSDVKAGEYYCWWSSPSASEWTNWGESLDFVYRYTYNILVTAPTVTTQAVDDITPNTAAGHGAITDIGGENCDKRGVCWNTGGNPTVANSKSEESGSFGTGAFTRPMTGLTPGQHYYVRAYAHNSAGYGYGSQVEFIASQRISPSAIPSSETFGTPAAIPGPVVISPSALASAEAFGILQVNRLMYLSAIASLEAFGSPQINQTIHPSAIDSGEAFGTAKVNQTIFPDATDSSEAFGTPDVIPGTASILPTGIPSAETFGALIVSISAWIHIQFTEGQVDGIRIKFQNTGGVSRQARVHEIDFLVTSPPIFLKPTGIPSVEAFGTPTICTHNVLQPSSIASAEVFGTPHLVFDQYLSPTSITSEESFGTPTVVPTAISYRYRYNVFTDNLDIVRAAMSYRYRYNVFTGNQDILGRL